MRFPVFCFHLLLLALPLAAQHQPGPCRVGPDLGKHLQLRYQQQPALEKIARDAEARQNQKLAEFNTLPPPSKRGPIYTIPVVFHVMTWQSDSGNDGFVDDAKIHEAMDIVNREFNALNGAFDDIEPAFAGLVADPQIEFVLAQRDPDGNPTSGITRDVTIHTYNGLWDFPELKRVHVWPRDKYLNIWVVQSSDGGNGSAWAYLPAQVAEGSGIEDLDGIVISTWALGATTPGYHSILTHEIGHSLNLRHTWGPGAHGSAEACDEDDDVADTPNCSGASGCNTNRRTCGSQDMIQNFMDYATCPIAFTQGQVTRMHAALNSDVALRNHLWSQDNLIDTGLANGPARASFATSAKRITPGEAVQFYDTSAADHQAITNWSWSFPGGSPSSYQGQNPPAVVYDQAGRFDVILSVTTAAGSHQTHRRRYIEVAHDLVMHPGTAVVGPGTFTDSQPTRYYDQNVDQTLTALPAEAGRMLRVSFAEFRLGAGDSLRIYDGTSSAAPLLGNYTGTQSPGVVTASNAQGALTFRFVADGDDNNYGWSAGLDYADAATTIMQNGSFQVAGGDFVDPGLNGNYGVEYDQTMTLTPAQPDSKLRVTFTSFKMEDVDENCEFDYLQIYDGTNTGAPLIGSFCSTGSPGIITATNPQGALTFRFVSDDNRTGPGWRAYLSQITEADDEILMRQGTQTTSGAVFMDGGKFANYSDNTDQTLTLRPQDSDRKLRVTFAAFLMEHDDADCAYDVVTVFDGETTAAPQVGTFCNTNSPGVVAATNPTGALTFRFVTDDNTTAPGWSSLVAQVDAADTTLYPMQSGTVQAESGIFTDAGRYGAYSNDADTVMTFVPPSGNPLTFTFGAFSMEPTDRTCLYDMLEIYDGTDTNAPSLGVFCNTTSPGKVTAGNPSGALTFRFISDDNTTGHGWAAHFGTEATPNQEPEVAVTAPGDGAVFTAGTTITFSGTATDAEDGDLAANLSWTSSLDGALGNGAAFSISTLSVGTHTVTASVNDSAGASGSAAISVTVEAGNEVPTIGDGETVSGLQAQQGQWIYYRIAVPDNAANLTLAISGGSGDADLYIRHAQQPTQDDWDCRPYRSGNNESCTVASPAAGDTYIGIRAYNSFSNLQLTASYQSDDRVGFTETDLAADQGAWRHFQIQVPAGASRLDISIEGGSGDADLYVKRGAQPSENDWDYRPWVSGNQESVAVPNPQTDTWFISLRGYRAFSGVTLNVHYQN
ncbi:CUB domain-containing protein [Acanthopleuribacter pedis]|uniref:Pre-peptidase C-terminal domain-containing protein n=1 Tax=Acanthopleuribacter pedis TaxID=442870 RepID=A0A8J7QMN2_9BACT|nr:CUB domain-containing protein [Acanthopleuribacter pedis]MBO1320800.1 pre-peptidase C-terminal domain-containing protein [Acanthopleuribacter pedis]